MLVPNHLYLSPKFLTHQLSHLLLPSIHDFFFFLALDLFCFHTK